MYKLDCSGSTPIYQAEELLNNITILIEKAHDKNVPVVYIQHSNPGALAFGSEDWQIHPNLHLTDNDLLIHKKQGNSFEGTSLEELLDSKSINSIVVTGLVTHGCVKATCVGALELGYQVVLVGDGHSSYSKDAPDLIIKWNQNLREMGAKIRNTPEIDF